MFHVKHSASSFLENLAQCSERVSKRVLTDAAELPDQALLVEGPDLVQQN